VQQAISFMNELSLNEAVVSSKEVEEKLSQIHSHINDTKAPVIQMKVSRKRWLITAAAAVLLLIGGITVFKLTQSKEYLNTVYGEIRSNRLPDGSTMILNANSKVELGDNWKDGKDREVWLNGEAFFKITKTPHKSRFIVHTDDLDVIVTGTQFNVMHRGDKTSVLLTEGSVTIRTKDGQELKMKPGDYIEMGGKSIERKAAKEDNVLAWKGNKLALDNTPLNEVAQIISNHYGVKVTLANNLSLSNIEPLTGILPNDNLDDLLEAVEVAADITVIRTDNGDIIFSPKK
ncbi:MAG: FecR domain-containing protein, partial [Chitinophagaceae bacterium]